jgi:hypothetical protein
MEPVWFNGTVCVTPRARLHPPSWQQVEGIVDATLGPTKTMKTTTLRATAKLSAELPKKCKHSLLRVLKLPSHKIYVAVLSSAAVKRFANSASSPNSAAGMNCGTDTDA